MKRKLLSVFLALCMTLTLVPTAFAGDTDTHGVTPAILSDPTSGVDSSYLYSEDSYKVTVTEAEQAAGYDYTVAISATDLKAHANTSGLIAYWCGFAVAAPESISGEGEDTQGSKPAKMKVASATTLEELKTAWNEATVGDLQEAVADGKSGFATYLNAGSETLKNSGRYYELQWADGEGKLLGEPTIYKADLSKVELAKDDTISAANLADKDGNPSGNLCSDYSVSSESVLDTNYGGYYTKVSVKATDLVKHTNGNGQEGYWVGFAVTAPEDAKNMKYGFASDYKSLTLSADATSLEANVADEASGIAFYADAGSETPKTWCKVQWLDENSKAISTAVYQMDLSGVTTKAQGNTNDVLPAILADKNGEKNLYSKFKLSAKQGQGRIEVVFDVDGLKEHTNANDKKGYWVGFALPAPEGAQKVKYAFAATQNNLKLGNASDLEANVTTDGKSGIAFYADAGDSASKTWAMVQWVGQDDQEIGEAVTYHMDLSQVDMVIDGIKPATQHDTSGAITDSYLCDMGTYAVYVSKVFTNSYYDVQLSAKNVLPHQNGADPSTKGAWVGFALPAPEKATHFKYAFGTSISDDAQANAVETIFPDETGVAVYLDASKAENNTSYFTVQWLTAETSGQVLGTYTYKVDLSGVTVDKTPVTFTGATVQEKEGDSNYVVSPSIQATVDNTKHTITLSGLAAADASASLKLLCPTSAGGQLSKELTLTYADGKFALSENATISLLGTTYSVVLGELTALAENVEVAVGEAATEIGSGISADDKSAVTAALGKTDVADATVVVAQAATKQITTVVNSLNTTELLEKANAGETGSLYDTIQVQTYLSITATSYDSKATDKAFVLEITPMYKVVAVDSDDSGKNAYDLKISGQLTNVSPGPVSITVGIPDGFVTNTESPVYVHHAKNAYTHVYKATVTGSADSGFTAKFTNPDGFSTFTLKTSAAASITDANGQETYYATLQNAVDAVANGGTIKLLASGSAIVSKKIAFTITPNGYTATITAGSGYENKGSGYNYDFVEKTGGGSSGGGGGGGSTVTTYTLTFDTNGGTAIAKVTKDKGTTINLSDYTTTRDGYTFAGWYADEGLTDKVTSITLDGNKTVYAKWTENAPVEPEPTIPFTDVNEGDWFYDAVCYVYENDMMNGVSETSFAPNATTSRAMIVTILYRLENEPAVSGSAFTDVPSGQWYSNAVAWAAENGIVNGVTDTTFAPNSAITREQMAAILYRYAAWKGCDVSGRVDLSGYTDAASVSAYATEAMAWANAEGLITGVTDTTLRPAGSAVRAQAATILMRLCENVLA